MQNRTKKVTSPRLSTITNKKKQCDATTNTTSEFVCEKCAENEKFHYTESEAFRNSYLKSINYINCCHSLMNELMYRKTGRYSMKLPDMPNFMDVLDALQDENSFVERGIVTEKKQQCEKSCGRDNTQTDGLLLYFK